MGKRIFLVGLLGSLFCLHHAILPGTVLLRLLLGGLPAHEPSHLLAAHHTGQNGTTEGIGEGEGESILPCDGIFGKMYTSGSTVHSLPSPPPPPMNNSRF